MQLFSVKKLLVFLHSHRRKTKDIFSPFGRNISLEHFLGRCPRPLLANIDQFPGVGVGGGQSRDSSFVSTPPYTVNFGQKVVLISLAATVYKQFATTLQ